MIGCIMRQGPHHGAQNSTMTGNLDSVTSDSQVASEAAGTATFKKHAISINHNNAFSRREKVGAGNIIDLQ